MEIRIITGSGPSYRHYKVEGLVADESLEEASFILENLMRGLIGTRRSYLRKALEFNTWSDFDSNSKRTVGRFYVSVHTSEDGPTEVHAPGERPYTELTGFGDVGSN